MKNFSSIKPSEDRPPWWRTLVLGLVAGATAGFLVLGPGMRLAMRVVAIQDPSQSPEFTIGGTLFIVMLFGLIIAPQMGLFAGIADRYLPRWATVSIVAGSGIWLIMSSPELSAELTELGAGPWVNVPMFATVFALFAYTDLRLLARFNRGVASRPEVVGEEVLV